LLLALTDPMHAEPFRLPGGKPTFCNRLHYELASSVPPANAGTLLMPNSGFAIVRRDPRCFMLVTQYVGSAQTSVYELISPENGNVLSSKSGGYFANVANYVGGQQTHGANYVAWVFSDGGTRFWFQNESASTSSVVITGLTASTGYTLTIDFFFAGVNTVITINATSDVTGSATFQLPASNLVGYALFKVAVTATGAAVADVNSLTLNDNSTTKVRHLALPFFWTTINDIDCVRINSASLMNSDRTAENYSQGDNVAFQAAGADAWDKMLGASGPANQNLDPYSTCANFNDKFEGPYKKGRYIPLKSTGDPRERQMLDMATDSDIWEITPINVTEQLDYLYVGFNVGVLGSGVPAPMSKWIAACHVEGEAESQWRETRIPNCHPDIVKEAEWAFSQVKCDFENPSHLSRIWAWVKANAPHILDAVGLASNVLPPQARIPIQTGTGVTRAIMNMLP